MAFGTSVASILGGAAGGSFVGGAAVRLMLDASQYQKGLKSSEAQLHAFGRRVTMVGRGMTRFGAGMTRNVTLPIVAATAASVKMAVDFETAFTRIRANSNLTNKEIDKLQKVVLDLAGKTGKAPRELAEGLYFLASAGLNARQVQETLTMSAKASAAGFGEVGDIAKLTANALNAYAKSGLKAKEVTDTLAAGVREGTAEPDEFAHALGRILPFASKAKVGFDEVVASLASLSNIGLDVNEGVTAMRGLMAGLLAPTKAASEALKDIGLSADQVRDSLARDGLLATMRLLEEATGGNIDKLKAIIPNIRALVGQFGITSQEANKVDKSFRRVIGATGDLNKSFRTTKKDPGFQMKQMLAELQVVAIELGREALPVLKDVVAVIRDGVRFFRGLSDEMQKNVIKWGLYAAALGPVVALFGRIVSLGGRAVGVLARVGAGAAAASAASGAAAAGGGAAAAGRGGLAFGAGKLAGAALATPVGQAAGLAVTLGLAGKLTGDLINRITGLETTAEEAKEALQSMLEDGMSTADLNRFNNALPSWAAELKIVAKEAAELGFKSKAASSEFARFMRVGQDLTEGQTRKLANTINKIFEYRGSLTVAERAAVLAALATGDFERAMKELRAALKDGKSGVRDAEGAIDGFQGAVGNAEGKVRNLTSAMHNVPRRLWTSVYVDTVQAHAAINGLMSAFSHVPRSMTVNAIFPRVNVPGRARGGPVSAGGAYIVGEKGPELFTPRQSGQITPNGAPLTIEGRMQITNWQTGEAHFTGVAVKAINSDHKRSARLGRSQSGLAT